MAFSALGGQDSNRVFYRLLGLYSHNRFYHDMNHIERLWRTLQRVRPGYQPEPEFIVALFLHDAIYHPGSQNNETASVALAREILPQAVPARLARVEAYIMATQTHQSQDPALQEFIDLDLSPLGGSEAEFARDVKNLRQEFRECSDADFHATHTRILASFAARQPLYYTAPFQTACEAAARRNIAKFAAQALVPA